MEAWKKGAVIGGVLGLLNIFGTLITDLINQPEVLTYPFYILYILRTPVISLVFGLIIGASFDVIIWEKSKLTFLIIALSFGTYFYHLRNPWNLVPYNIIYLAIIWWLVFSYNVLTKKEFIKKYAIASSIAFLPILSIYILVIPSLSIILRGFLKLNQITDFTFLSLAVYIFALHGYYWILEKLNRELKLGKKPSFRTSVK